MEQRFDKAAQITIKQCLNVKPDESVLIITDQLEREIGYALFEAAKSISNDTFIIEIIPAQHHGQEPPKQIAALMSSVDVVVAPTFRSLTHTEARRTACRAGARVATMPGILLETFVRAMIANYSAIAALSIKLADMLSSAKMARITTERGTDLSMSLDGRTAIADTGILHNPGDFGNLPAGEAYIAPLEGSTSGTLVIDGSIGDTGILASDDKIKTRIEKGFATEIDGGRAAAYLIGVLSQFTREARNIAELGIGTNPSARLCGNLLEDEKVMGTVHVALGNNISMGGHIDVPIHLDGIILSPNIWLDGKMIMEHGRLKI